MRDSSPNELDRLLAAQAIAQDHEIQLKKQANDYQAEIHQIQSEKEQKVLAEFAAQYRDNSITVEALKHQNTSLVKQI